MYIYMYMHIYVYIYIYTCIHTTCMQRAVRERDTPKADFAPNFRADKVVLKRAVVMNTHIRAYIYIYMYIYRYTYAFTYLYTNTYR